MKTEITFKRLSEIDADEILAHMSDPRLANHMPLMKKAWTKATIKKFVARKEQGWQCHGLGHWAILSDQKYVGWGGFEKEGSEWDFGLVLTPEAFGLGPRIARMALAFALNDERIPYVTFLLPPSRTKRGALRRLGATFVDYTDYDGQSFLKYRLETY